LVGPTGAWHFGSCLCCASVTDARRSALGRELVTDGTVGSTLGSDVHTGGVTNC
jgi:hypothetical protein